MRAFDVVMLGSGPGGYAAALTAGRRGLRAAIVERGAIGGVCLNVGCIPTKALIATSHLLRRVRQAELGVRVGPVALDYSQVHARMQRIVEQCRQGMTTLLRQHQIEIIAGGGRFEDAHTLRVSGQAEERLRADRFVVATGGSPSPGPWAFDGSRIVSYRELLRRDTLPSSLLIIGGGVIGCEFASCLSSFGVPVTLIERETQLLPLEDAEAVRLLTHQLQAQGVKVLTGAAVQSLTTMDDAVEAIVSSPSASDGGSQRVQADVALIAVGQRPNSQDLGLEALGIQTQRGIVVDRWLRTSQPHIAAVGDCVPGHGLAHLASAEGIVAVRNLLDEPMVSLDEQPVPRCVFTDPELAQVGITEAQAPASARISRFAFAALGKSLCDGEAEGFVKLVVDAETDRVLGTTILGAQASTLIHSAVLAIQHGLTAKQLARTITVHPTLPEAFSEAAAQVHGEAIYTKGYVRSPRA